MRIALVGSILLAACGILGGAGTAGAWERSGRKEVALRTRDGAIIPIGRVTVTPGPEATRFAVGLDTAKFEDFFLSMGAFKCLEGPEVQCYVPYLSVNAGTVKPTDLTWIEHALILFCKTPADFGARLNNGLYCAPTRTEDGLVATPMSIDLNDIASPSQDPAVPPFDAGTRTVIVPGTRLIDARIIR